MEKDFLQSAEWRKFQEAVGRPTFLISGPEFHAGIIEHSLPIVGKYFYIPRGPVVSKQETVDSKQYFDEVIELAKKERAGWIRIDGAFTQADHKIVKAPHDMQPREVLMLDIAKPEVELLAGMKSKTRYNIKLAEKKGIKIAKSDKGQVTSEKYLAEFLRLIKITAERDKIIPHPDSYYQKMFATLPAEILKLYVAEYEGKIIAANLVVFFGDTCIYLHGASDSDHRNLMAPYLLQWRQIQDAKQAGCKKYDLGGVSTAGKNGWAGITRFKQGFAEKSRPIEFPGSYDIVINLLKYNLYRILQTLKKIF